MKKNKIGTRRGHIKRPIKARDEVLTPIKTKSRAGVEYIHYQSNNRKKIL